MINVGDEGRRRAQFQGGERHRWLNAPLRPSSPISMADMVLARKRRGKRV
jgi:hypothetical protein